MINVSALRTDLRTWDPAANSDLRAGSCALADGALLTLLSLDMMAACSLIGFARASAPLVFFAVKSSCSIQFCRIPYTLITRFLWAMGFCSTAQPSHMCIGLKLMVTVQNLSQAARAATQGNIGCSRGPKARAHSIFVPRNCCLGNGPAQGAPFDAC